MNTTTVSKKSQGGFSDVAKELKRKAGFPVDDEPETKTSKTKKTKKAAEEEADDNGGLGGVFGKMGIDLGNLGGLAESVLKTIGLAGKSVK